MNCSNCGSEMAPGQAFCKQCGTPVTPAPTAPATPAKKSGGAPVVPIVIGVIALLVVCCLCLAAIGLGGLCALPVLQGMTQPTMRPTRTAVRTTPVQVFPTAHPASTPVPTKAPVTQISLWHSFAQTDRTVLEGIVNDYNKKNPTVRISVLYVPSDQIKPRLQTASAAGAAPTMVINFHDWLGDKAMVPAFRPLDDLAPADLVEQLNPVSVRAVTLEGKLYAMPLFNVCVALYYNKDLLGRRSPPKTVDEMLTMAGEMAPAGGYGLGWNSQFYYSFGYLGAFGGALFDDNYKCILDQGSGTVEFLTFLKTMKDTKGVTMGQTNMGEQFKIGKVAMVNEGIWALADYEKALGADKVGVVPLPAAKNPATPFLSGESMFFSNQAKAGEAKAAMAFVAYLLAPEQGKLFVEKAYRLPANTAVDLSSHPNIAAFAEQARTAVSIPAAPEMGAVWGPAADMVAKVLQGTATPEEAVAEAVKLINSQNQK